MKINFTADNGFNMENWFREKTKNALNASMKLAEHFDGTGDMNEIVYDLLWDVVYPLCMISGMCYGVNTLRWDDVKEVFEKGVSGADAFFKKLEGE